MPCSSGFFLPLTTTLCAIGIFHTTNTNLDETRIDDASIDPDDELSYAAIVGKRLRAVRRQKRFSLQAVAAASGQEFKASVLGAYERGERAISVPRLQRLARLYDVPVEQLLPDDLGEIRVIEASDPTPTKARIDLNQLRRLDTPEALVLQRFLQQIQVDRQDFNGQVLTIRRSDLNVLAAALGQSVSDLHRYLETLGVLYRL